jgi:hypothetical protein
MHFWPTTGGKKKADRAKLYLLLLLLLLDNPTEERQLCVKQRLWYNLHSLLTSQEASQDGWLLLV